MQLDRLHVFFSVFFRNKENFSIFAVDILQHHYGIEINEALIFDVA